MNLLRRTVTSGYISCIFRGEIGNVSKNSFLLRGKGKTGMRAGTCRAPHETQMFIPAIVRGREDKKRPALVALFNL